MADAYQNADEYYEVVEFATLPLLLLPNAIAAAAQRPAHEWCGPLSKDVLGKCRGHHTLHIGHTRPGGSGNPKKFMFQHEFVACSCSPMFHYKHCSGMYDLLIRKVRPSPEIHLHMQKHAEGTRVTAVAEDDLAIMEVVFTRDARCTQFKADLKNLLVLRGDCTKATVLTMYHDNILMTSNAFIRKDYKANRKNRLPKVIVAKDGRLTDAPQSRQDEFPSPSTWARHLVNLLSNEPFDSVTDDEFCKDGVPEPAPKKQKTAVADPSRSSGDAQSSGLPNRSPPSSALTGVAPSQAPGLASQGWRHRPSQAPGLAKKKEESQEKEEEEWECTVCGRSFPTAADHDTDQCEKEQMQEWEEEFGEEEEEEAKEEPRRSRG